MTSLLATFSRRGRNRARSSASSSDDVTASSSLAGSTSNSPPPVPSPVPQLPRNPRGGGRDTLSDGGYARKCRDLMALLKDLRALGANTVFDLPKIVVIGNQSAGKSSLIESVTGINVPRDSGTCTRCPMECSMSSAATSWSCTISLRSGIEESSFGPNPITNKADVELWLRRAQGAILSMDSDKSQWRTKSAEEIKAAIENKTGMREFTEDTIVVDIQDPHATDLSFVDLPGIISNGDPRSVKLIKDLVRRHVVGDNTLILVTIPANDDIQNHGAVVLAKEADISGDRTIVVLTKPDSLGDGDIGLKEIWKQTFENRNVPNNPNYLRHGYYCVRLPNDQERGQGHTMHTLSDYLNVTKPWSDFADKGRFGVTNLVRDISALLVQMIEANLPHLRAAIEVALKQCIDRLGQLPAVVSHDNEMASIMLLINAFLREINTASVGETHKTLAQACRRRYRELRDEVEGTCPKFQRNKTGGGIIYNVQDVRGVIDDCTGWELPGVIPYDAYKTFIKRFLDGWKNLVQKCFEDVYDEFSTFIVDLSTSHFSGFTHLNAFVLRHVRAELQKSRSMTEASVLKLLDVEAQPYFSQRRDFSSEQEKWMNNYWQEFYPYETGQYHRFKDEIHVMATVRTYFQFAFERFADTVLLTQEHGLVQSLESKLEVVLFNEVSHLSGGLKQLLAEDENVERERRELVSRRRGMLGMRNRLDAYGTV